MNARKHCVSSDETTCAAQNEPILLHFQLLIDPRCMRLCLKRQFLRISQFPQPNIQTFFSLGSNRSATHDSIPIFCALSFSAQTPEADVYLLRILFFSFSPLLLIWMFWHRIKPEHVFLFHRLIYDWDSSLVLVQSLVLSFYIGGHVSDIAAERTNERNLQRLSNVDDVIIATEENTNTHSIEVSPKVIIIIIILEHMEISDFFVLRLSPLFKFWIQNCFEWTRKKAWQNTNKIERIQWIQARTKQSLRPFCWARQKR